jgi:hypothetical protein
MHQIVVTDLSHWGHIPADDMIKGATNMPESTITKK